MRILVTGGSGLLGSRIVKYGTLGNEIFGTYLKHSFSVGGAKFFKSDITNKNDIEKIINKVEPDVVVHAAALVNADLCETNYDKTYKINVKGVKNVAEVSLQIGAKFIFISSSYVFDGKSGPYSEEDKPNPINKYGEMKLICENFVPSMFKDWLIIRTSVIYGWNVMDQRLNFIAWIIDQLSKNKKIRIITDQTGTPTFGNNGAQAIIKLIKKGKKGIYNIVGSESISRFNLALKIAKIFGLNKNLLIPINSISSGQIAKRPVNDSLNIDKARNELDFHFFNVEEGLLAMKNRSREEEQKWLLRNTI